MILVIHRGVVLMISKYAHYRMVMYVEEKGRRKMTNWCERKKLNRKEEEERRSRPPSHPFIRSYNLSYRIRTK